MRFVLIFWLFSLQSEAQINHFIYIQTENRQPFYVKLNNRVYSSSAAGYLIIPKLPDGNYTLSIGFPKNEWPSQNIPVLVNRKDAGFLLKNFNEKGWGLFNLQTMEVITAAEKAVTGKSLVKNETDSFSNVLAAVTNIPADKKSPPVLDTSAIQPKELPVNGKKVEIPLVSNPPVAVTKPDTILARKNDTLIAVNPLPVTVVTGQEKSVHSIRMIQSMIDQTGRSIVYVAAASGSPDTITIFIPYAIIEQPEKLKTEIVNAVPDNGHVLPVKEDTTMKELPKTGKDVGAVHQSSSDTTVQLIEPVHEMKAVTNPAISVAKDGETIAAPHAMIITNTGCKANADQDDFLKLRKKMAAADNDEEMIAVAKKVFKTRCFSTSQLKNLGVLFLNEEGRYQFLDAAYPYTNDVHQFRSLQVLLSDEYYIRRFNALIR